MPPTVRTHRLEAPLATSPFGLEWIVDCALDWPVTTYTSPATTSVTSATTLEAPLASLAVNLNADAFKATGTEAVIVTVSPS